MNVPKDVDVNSEKLSILKQEGNILVTANPGTGKTYLLTQKYIVLVENGINPKDILCLTFTTKAKKELEDRLIKEFKKRGKKYNLSDINVHTFHSYTLDCIGDQEIVSSNLLRYAIYKILQEKDVLNYGEEYLINTIVPKMENLLRYIKNYGLTSKDINLETVKGLITGSEKYTKEELDSFANYFLEIFEYYELIKSSKGIDYTDMLLEFLKLKKIPTYEYVLVDELQDVNSIEAKISLKSGKHFVAVGDKKQAIFGFQGGSISNFKLFENSKKFVLFENFRSTQEILDYAKNHFITNTQEESYKEELTNLKNGDDKHGEKPIVYSVEKDKINSCACDIAIKIANEFESESSKQVAIITRTNSQVISISKELKARNVEHSSTYFSASKEAKENIILFIKSLLSYDIKEIKRGLFTPFFPIKIQEAFKIAENKDLTLNNIYSASPEFKRLREQVSNVKRIDELFDEFILPLCIAYGEEYLYAGLSVRASYLESLKFLEDITYTKLGEFMSSSDLLSKDVDSKNKIVVTTVHKAKGLQFDSVVYLPKKPKNNSNFQDLIVEKILESKNINAKEELEEELERINFVAFTRAKNNLFILNDKPEEYDNEYSQLKDYEVSEEYETKLSEKVKKAFNLFLIKEYDKAKNYLESKNEWSKEFFKNFFCNLTRISFTSLNTNPLEFLKRNILKLQSSSTALSLGTEVHDFAENYLNNLNPEIKDESLQPYLDNVKTLIEEIKKDYPEVYEPELLFQIQIKDLFDIQQDFIFSGKIDAIFKNKDEYLIVDWKTSKDDSKSSEYRRQLLSYKKALSIEKKIPEDNIKVAIGYVGLRSKINTGKINYLFDDAQPRKTAINTLKKHVEKILDWKNDYKTFIDDLIKENQDEDKIWCAIVEQLKNEK